MISKKRRAALYKFLRTAIAGAYFLGLASCNGGGCGGCEVGDLGFVELVPEEPCFEYTVGPGCITIGVSGTNTCLAPVTIAAKYLLDDENGPVANDLVIAPGAAFSFNIDADGPAAHPEDGFAANYTLPFTIGDEAVVLVVDTH